MRRRLLVAAASVLLAGLTPPTVPPIPIELRAVDEAVVMVRRTNPGGGTGAGTAFAISSDSQGTYLLTDRHVVLGAKSLRIETHSPTHTIAAAQVWDISRDGEADLAIIKVSNMRMKPLVFSTSAENDGNGIVAASYPAAIEDYFDATSALPQPVIDSNASITAIGGTRFVVNGQLDDGSSGGPLLVKSTYHVAGIVLSKSDDGRFVWGLRGDMVILPYLNDLKKRKKLSFDTTATLVPADNDVQGNWTSGEFSGSSNFGGAPFCNYQVTMTVRKFAFVVAHGTVSRAVLVAHFREIALPDPKCPWATLPENDQTFLLANGSVSGTRVDLSFHGISTNQPLSNASFGGTLDAAGDLPGTMSFRRVDAQKDWLNAPVLINWTVQYPVFLKRSP